ncbi:MAG: type I glyceraldehyde-3-phosphate dehydrogenase [Peptococcaceae bacterium]|nr:type I glyceraldehyde-3-phosphate dehydrogenase [Peptococcaceae bacterium]
MTVKIGINGFGRIGRNVFRAAFSRPDIEIVAINNRTVGEIMAHMLKYDSVHGVFDADVEFADGKLIVNDKVIQVVSFPDPADIPWGELGVDIVIESTGKFNKGNDCQKHIDNGAKKVVISAPAKEEDITIVMGVNEEKYDPKQHHIISNASCTTNCLAPFAKVLLEEFGIKRGLMTTVHSYTNDQQILDQSHKDFRRARAAALSIIPTSTGAAKAVGLVLPELKGKLNGFSLRVPTPNVSVVDLVVELDKPATVETVNAALKAASTGRQKGILGYSDLPLVSTDYVGTSASCIIDGLSSRVVDDTMIKVVAWYDNEWGYSERVVDLALYVAAQGL